MKKHFGAEIWKGYCPNRNVRGGLYCKTRFVLQPRWLVQGRIVLQDGCSWLRNYIAIQFIVLQEEADLVGIVLQNLYCRSLGCREIVSQYKNCIVTRQGTWAGLYCNTATAPATQHGLGARARGARQAWSSERAAGRA